MAEGPAKTLAALLDMAEVTVRAYAQEGVFVEAGRNQYLLAPSVRNYVRCLREEAAGRKGGRSKRRRRKRPPLNRAAQKL
jgi:hypothetical protein